ncbi:zinc finger protein CONSTANS-LIKE 16-like [Tasmannia lanceolata]|uniref:zinc finger protein CONSTANS-LIKE 16-like n=1 Tax=Tasmannia lanceolata TaxID=3420 RepID=UPI004063FE15
MSSEKRAANAIGAKTARACESCMRKRARWYCAADEAYLCQGCDSSIHSANPLARRHERVRLKTASLKLEDSMESFPAWHHGFTRKARTPRQAKPNSLLPPAKAESSPNPLLVPELGSDDPDDSEEQLLYRVPIFDPVVEEFCTSMNATAIAVEESKPLILPDYTEATTGGGDTLPGFLPSDVDLAEFAADVESLLGRGLDDDTFCMEGLGLLDSKEDEMGCCFDSGRVKVEEDDVEGAAACHVDVDMDLSRDKLELEFDYDIPTVGEEEEEKGAAAMEAMNNGYSEGKRISLRLDYKAVMVAWASKGSPWTTGERPHFNLEDGWPDYVGACATNFHSYYNNMGGIGGQMMAGDGGREARVTRYREKRRTRLFSKKIRYEVRKLNAEKRPRMKGRFVKRVSFTGTGFPY